MGHRPVALFQAALTDFMRNNCSYMAAGIAYWTLFSLFPLVLAGLSVLGFVSPTPEEQVRIVEGIFKVVPVSEEYLAQTIGEVARARGAVGAVALAGLLFSGTAVFSAVRKGINHAWHIREPQFFLLERAIDLVMLMGVAVLAFLAVVLSTNVLGVATAARPPDWLGGGVAGKLLLEIGALAVTFGVFLLLYRFVPNTKVQWREVWLGALIGAVLFQVVRTGFGWFVASFGSFNVVYGSLGAVMAVLVWAYLSALALVWGAQVAFTQSRGLGSPAVAGALPELRPGARPRGVVATVASWLLPPKRDRP